jgi:hypothetical protein
VHTYYLWRRKGGLHGTRVSGLGQSKNGAARLGQSAAKSYDGWRVFHDTPPPPHMDAVHRLNVGGWSIYIYIDCLRYSRGRPAMGACKEERSYIYIYIYIYKRHLGEPCGGRERKSRATNNNNLSPPLSADTTCCDALRCSGPHARYTD